MRPVCHPHGNVFDIFYFREYNDIKNIFVKSILVQKIAYTSLYDSIMSYKHFEIKKERFASFITVKNRQLSTVPLNFDCSRVWQ